MFAFISVARAARIRRSLVECETVLGTGEFVDTNKEMLKTMPAPRYVG